MKKRLFAGTIALFAITTFTQPLLAGPCTPPPHHHGGDDGRGVRLATDIVNLTAAALKLITPQPAMAATQTALITQPVVTQQTVVVPPAVVTQPLVVVQQPVVPAQPGFQPKPFKPCPPPQPHCPGRDCRRH